MQADNHINDCGEVGIYALAGAVSFMPWWGATAMRHTTTIDTTTPRAKYTAIRAIASKIVPGAGALSGGIGAYQNALVRILNRDLTPNADYYGIVLEAQSLLLGGRYVTYSDPTINPSNPTMETVPRAQQIVLKTGEGNVRVE